MAKGSPALDIRDADAVTRYILGDAVGSCSPSGFELVRKAYAFSHRAHEGQTRDSGEPYIIHPIEVARLLAERTPNPEAVAAAILHDVIEDCGVDHVELSHLFGETVANLVEGVTKINIAKGASAAGEKLSRQQKAETLRKMILAMLEDVRVILIKFADRVHNLRTLDALSEARRRKVATETLEIFSPLANRLGMTHYRVEMEERSMPHLFPDEWKDLQRRVEARAEEYNLHVQESVDALRQRFKEADFPVEIKGRRKQIYSLFMKMNRLGIGFDEIHDLVGLRVIVNTTAECYAALGVIHGLWPPLDGRLKDYIGRPKANGYQSIHTTVVRPGGMRVEVQIRTAEMHRLAEDGMAAHWRYKEGMAVPEGERDTLAEKQSWLRRLAEGLDEMRDPAAFQEALRTDILSDTVFCFTPKGQIVNLPRGSTAVDFAYYIHTDVGHRCVSALVNRKAVPLRTALRNGDFVQIITAEHHRPSRSWLDIVRTSRARSKILQYFRSKEQGEYAIEGRKLLAKAMKKRRITETAAGVENALQQHYKAYGMQSVEALLAEIGFGVLRPDEVLKRLFPELTATPPPASPVMRQPTKRSSVDGVQIVGLPVETPINLAKCCTPVRGDAIVGYVNSYSRVFNVHRQNCTTLRRRLQAGAADGQVFPASWSGGNEPLSVRIRVQCLDYTGLLSDITNQISEEQIAINYSHTVTHPPKNPGDPPVADLQFSIEVRDVEQLDKVIAKLRRNDKVLHVMRHQRQRRPGATASAPTSTTSS